MINIEYGCNEQGDAKAVWKPIKKKKTQWKTIKCFGLSIDSLSERFKHLDC